MENKKEPLMSYEDWDKQNKYTTLREHIKAYSNYHTKWHLNNAKEFVAENDTISHHINVLAERIADNYSVSYMTDDGIETSKLKKEKVLKIANDYINELNLQNSK